VSVTTFGLKDKSGVLVAKVLEGGPAAKAGVKELLSVVAKTDIGRKIKIVIIRGKKEMILDLEVGERPEETTNEESEEIVKSGVWRGLQVEDKKGVVVVNVEPDSFAEAAGIMLGDIITQVDNQAVSNLTDYDKITKASKANVLIKTRRGYFLIKSGK